MSALLAPATSAQVIQTPTPLSNIPPEELLEMLPRKHGQDDLVEVLYDESIIPALVSLVSKGTLRAAFLLETPAQKILRESFNNAVHDKDFWNIMRQLGFQEWAEDVAENYSVFKVSLRGEKALSLQLPFTLAHIAHKIPQSAIVAARQQAHIMQKSIPNNCTVLSSFFPGDDTRPAIFKGRYHKDDYAINIHQTYYGERGMDYIIDPDKKEPNNPDDIGIIDTGTITIFGNKLYHASSPRTQLSVVTGISNYGLNYPGY